MDGWSSALSSQATDTDSEDNAELVRSCSDDFLIFLYVHQVRSTFWYRQIFLIVFHFDFFSWRTTETEGPLSRPESKSLLVDYMMPRMAAPFSSFLCGAVKCRFFRGFSTKLPRPPSR